MDIIDRTARSPLNPRGYPVVHAATVTEASDDIPLVRAYPLDPPTPNFANDPSR